MSHRKKGHRTNSDVCHTEKNVTEQPQMYVTLKKGHRTKSDVCHTEKRSENKLRSMSHRKKVTEQTLIYATQKKKKGHRTDSDLLRDT